MNELALFAGAGGGILGGYLLGFRTICAVEIDSYCASVLAQRQTDRILPPFPIWSDARSFDGTAWRGLVDVVSAGFPCQPHSVAGKRLGASDPRNLWPDTGRIIREVEPDGVLLENVPTLVSNGMLHTILADLAAMGFDAEWGVVSAAETGAPHERERLWVVAHSNRAQRTGRSLSSGIQTQLAHPGIRGWWTAEPGVDRVANGMASQMDRLKAIGNGQVPAVVALAWRLLK